MAQVLDCAQCKCSHCHPQPVNGARCDRVEKNRQDEAENTRHLVGLPEKMTSPVGRVEACLCGRDFNID